MRFQIKSYSANSNLSLTVNLKSREPIRKVGTRKYLLITTRGLCCCPKKGAKADFSGLLEAIPIDEVFKIMERDIGTAFDATCIDALKRGMQAMNARAA